MRDLKYYIKSAISKYRMRRLISGLDSSNGRILEIGSGNSPVSCSTVLLDKYVSATKIHRTGSGPITNTFGKPFVLGDGNSLPFKDNAFPIIICRHVIEHLDDPVGFVAELQRVAASGYLEWPSIMTELVSGGYGHQNRIRSTFPNAVVQYLEDLEHGHGTRGHRWFIVAVGQRLYFLPKSKELYPLYLLLGKYAKASRKRFSKITSEKTSSLVWSMANPIEPVVISYGQEFSVFLALNEHYNAQEQISFLRKQKPAPGELHEAIYGLLQCPSCKQGDLSKGSSFLTCTVCKKEYPIINGVPVLLPTTLEGES